MRSNSEKLIEQAKKKLSVTDYGLSKKMGVSPQAVAHWRYGRSVMNDDQAANLASILEQQAEIVMALIAADRAPSELTRNIWTSLAKNLQRASALVILGGIAAVLHVHCILC